MNEMQKISFQLLIEIDKICKENQLTYFLGPKSLATAMLHRGYDRNLICPDLLMPVNDMDRLIQILDSSMPADRSIEYMGNSKNFIGFQLSYVNEKSTYLQMKRGSDVSKSGIRINIIPIRKKTFGFRAKALRVIETGWECNGFRLTKKINIKTIIAAGFCRFCMLMGKANFAKLLFHKYQKYYAFPTDMVVIKETKKKSIVMDYDFFSDADSVKFEGTFFPAPQNKEEFLTAYFGELWRENLSNRTVNFMDTILLPTIPYRDFIYQANQNGYDINKYFRHYRYSLINGIWVLPAIRQRSKAILIAKRSGDRLRYYEEFQQKREIIHNLYGKKKFEELREVFAEHEKTTLFYLKRRLGFCVSEEFFDIQCALFRHYGRSDIVDRLLKLVPKEHYKPIV